MYVVQHLSPVVKANQAAEKARNVAMKTPKYLTIAQEAGEGFEQKLQELVETAANKAREARRKQQQESQAKNRVNLMIQYQLTVARKALDEARKAANRARYKDLDRF